MRWWQRLIAAGGTDGDRSCRSASTGRASSISLSHVALPFPLSDGLYGLRPDPAPDEDFGMRLGAVAPRGERGVLVLDPDSLVRMSSNPFYPYLMGRIEGVIGPARVASAGCFRGCSKVILSARRFGYCCRRGNGE